ncbi:MAG: HAD family hydrolase [Chloroflexi bacterium]|nr:HAD family hydrolase [Chloroflexota bacterium]
MANSIKAIFFDLDGTLRHNLPSGGEVFADYAALLGLPINDEDRLRAIRWENYYWAHSIELQNDKLKYPNEADFWLHYSRRQLAALGASKEQVKPLSLKVSQYMEESYRPKNVVPEDVVPMLAGLQNAGYKMAVVSNREQSYQQELEKLGLAPFFIFSLAAGEVNSFKPNREIFIHACKRADVHPNEAVYVGDNYFADAIGARRAGLQPVLYDPRRIFPDAECPIIGSFDQLISVVQTL